MKTVSVRELKHEFTKVIGWVQDGDEVEIRKRGQIVARLVPPAFKLPRRRKKTRPDFFARMRKTYGDKAFPDNIVVAEREASRW